MRVVDLTHKLSPQMHIYPVYPRPTVFRWTSRETFGFSSNALFLAEHMGTHLDAPLHFIDRGLPVDELGLDIFFGEALILRFKLGRDGLIGVPQVESALRENRERIRRGERVLIDTGWYANWGRDYYAKKNPALTKEAAEYLARKRVTLLGIDTPSIDSPRTSSFPVHNILLAKGIPIIENLNLAKMPRAVKRFTLIALPMKIGEGTGSPLRVAAVIE